MATKTFKTGDDPVEAQDLPAVMEILKGPSPFSKVINDNVSKMASSLRHTSFRFTKAVLDSTQRTELQDLAKDHALGNTISTQIMGFTDKASGEIFLQEYQPRTANTYLQAALHECVHLVSSPVDGSSANSTARGVLDRGLEEALVEWVAQCILKHQNIPRTTDPGKRPFEKQISVLQALMLRIPDIGLWGGLLFSGTGGIQAVVLKHFDIHPASVDPKTKVSVPSQATAWEWIKLLTTGIEGKTSQNPADRALGLIEQYWPLPGTTSAATNKSAAQSAAGSRR